MQRMSRQVLKGWAVMMLEKRVSARASNAIGCACAGAVVELAVS